MLQIVRATLADALEIVWDALRLLARHWPVLVALFLAGAIFHDGLLWFCVWLSAYNNTLAGFVLPLVPLSTLTAMVLMLRQLLPDLRHVEPPRAAVEQADDMDTAESRGWRDRWLRLRDPARARLTLLASSLIPFLTVYVSQDWLKEDGQAFLNAAYFNETQTKDIFIGEQLNGDRLFIGQGPLLIGIVVGAFVLRWGLGRFELADRAVGWGLVAAYVEVLWVFLLAKSFDNYRESLLGWVEDRRLTHWLIDAYQWVIGLLGPVGKLVDPVLSWFWALVGNADDLIVIPIAWLTVGAVVYGRQLAAKERAESAARARWRTRAERVPRPLRKAGNEFTETVRERFSALGNGLRLLASAGLPAMLFFCVIFLAAAKLQDLVQWILRVVIGPRDTYDGLAFGPMLDVISRGFYLVVLVVLLGAAVDRILARAEQRGLVETTTEPVIEEALGEPR